MSLRAKKNLVAPSSPCSALNFFRLFSYYLPYLPPPPPHPQRLDGFPRIPRQGARASVPPPVATPMLPMSSVLSVLSDFWKSREEFLDSISCEIQLEKGGKMRFAQFDQFDQYIIGRAAPAKLGAFDMFFPLLELGRLRETERALRSNSSLVFEEKIFF